MVDHCYYIDTRFPRKAYLVDVVEIKPDTYIPPTVGFQQSPDGIVVKKGIRVIGADGQPIQPEQNGTIPLPRSGQKFSLVFSDKGRVDIWACDKTPQELNRAQPYWKVR